MSAQAMVAKKFVLYYKPEFAGGERVQLVEEGFFTEENGFRPFEIREIKKVRENETINVGPLIIWRVV